MHINFLDPYRHGLSPVHRLDARVKLPLVLAFILTSALAPVGDWPIYVLLLALALSAELLSGLGLVFFLKRALLALPFVMAALPVLFTVDGPALLALPFGLTITAPGLIRFLSIAWKSWISIQAALLLAVTTPFPDILLALRSLRIPRLLVAMIGLMWRYLFVMADEAARMLRARLARSGVSGLPAKRYGGTLGWRARTTGGMAGSLLLRGLERSDRIYMAMLARGYDGEVRTLPRSAIPARDWRVLALGLALLASLMLLGSLS